jgi:hypoxanthine-guanine phosphoribosyltransferase
MTTPEELFTQAEVDDAIDELAAAIDGIRDTKRLVFLAVLEGGRWLSDRLAGHPVLSGKSIHQRAVKASRTVEDGVLGDVVISPAFGRDLLPELTSRDVVLIDDIFDEGRTLEALTALVSPVANRVRSVVLVRRIRPDTQKAARLPDFTGLETQNQGWLVGCGMDSSGRMRNLPYVGIVNTDKTQS